MGRAAVYSNEVDVHVMDLVFSRFYTSFSWGAWEDNVSGETILGPGWTTNYDMRLFGMSNQGLLMRDSNGNFIIFNYLYLNHWFVTETMEKRVGIHSFQILTSLYLCQRRWVEALL